MKRGQVRSLRAKKAPAKRAPKPPTAPTPKVCGCSFEAPDHDWWCKSRSRFKAIPGSHGDSLYVYETGNAEIPIKIGLGPLVPRPGLSYEDIGLGAPEGRALIERLTQILAMSVRSKSGTPRSRVVAAPEKTLCDDLYVEGRDPGSDLTVMDLLDPLHPMSVLVRSLPIGDKELSLAWVALGTNQAKKLAQRIQARLEWARDQPPTRRKATP